MNFQVKRDYYRRASQDPNPEPSQWLIGLVVSIWLVLFVGSIVLGFVHSKLWLIATGILFAVTWAGF